MGDSIVNENSIVIKANSLVEASYKLTINEQKLVLIVASLVKKDDEDFKIYKLKVKELANILDMDLKNAYKELQKVTYSLMSKVLKLKVPNKKNPEKRDLLQISWFSSVRYITGEGEVEASFDPQLKPFLLNLKKHFTYYELKNIIQLKSSYSIRIYELLKQYQTIGNRTISILDIRNMLGIENKKYPRYANFKQKVLNVAYQEINENTDIKFEFEEIKKGRKVDKIKFIIKSNTDIRKREVVESEVAATAEESILTEEDLYIEKLKSFIEEDLSKDDFRAILKVAKNDIDKIKEKYEVSKVSKYDGLIGFLISAIIGDYKMPIKSTRSKNGSNKFHNFKQRTDNYSSDELENMVRKKSKRA